MATEEIRRDDAPAGTSMSDRYALLAAKSAAKAEIAVRSAEMAYGGEDPRGCKRARREAKDWCELATMDAMRAHGALAAENNMFEAKHPKAEEAMKAAEQARDAAANWYRKLKSGDD